MKANNILMIIVLCVFMGCQSDSNSSHINISKKTIYKGGWPFNPNKDSINNPGFGECPRANGCECETNSSCPESSVCAQLYRGKYCVPNEGSAVPRFKGVDQFGEQFDLYDLAMKGKPILLELGAATAQACQDLSAWRSHKSDEALERKWWKNRFSRLRDLIDKEEIFWVHIIHLDENKSPAGPKTVNFWHENYPHDNIIILADPEAKMKKWIRPTGLPCMVVLDENMILKQHAFRGVEDAINAVYQMLD